MERNRWETAIRCLEVAVHPGTGDDEVIAAVNGFRRTADGIPLSRICIEFSCGGVPLAELARMKESLERLNRENLELRRELAAGETAKAAAASRLDAAYARIHELTEEAAAAHRLAEAARQEFANFRDAYARTQDGAGLQLRWEIDAARHPTADQAATLAPAMRPFSAVLTEARLRADQAASLVGDSTGSGRLAGGDTRQQPPSA